MAEWIGYRWLAARYGVQPVQPFRVESTVGGTRSTRREGGYAVETYPSSYHPGNTLSGQLTFALKYEGVHLEFLHRLFSKVVAADLDAWIAHEPTGQYARRACFFYEWLTNARLAFPGVTTGNYVDALDPDECVTAAAPARNQRWRVNDNLPGVPAYCPTVLRTAAVKAAEAYDIAAKLRELEVEFGEDLLRRSAVWLTVKESRASFAIEREEQETDRVQRFAGAIEKLTGAYDDPLNEKALAEMQAAILGPKAIRYGTRLSPVFVGESEGFDQAVHYIAPHWKDAPGLLEGLREFAARSRTRPSMVRAAVLSFGFVYIHPMADANGRISRFLVNDTLRRDGAVPAPFILPVSATIVSSSARKVSYDRILEVFSKPLMRHYEGAYRFGGARTGEDEVSYNLEFDAYDDALSAWRYPDLTDHVEYLADVVRNTVEVEMRQEAVILRNFRRARESVKEVIEGPDADIDRIIRSVRANDWQISGKLAAEFPQLADPDVAQEMVNAVRSGFAPE